MTDPPPPPPPPWGQSPTWGQPPAWAQPFAVTRTTPGEAIAALILGIVALTVCSIVGWLPGGIALWLGTKAKRQIDADPGRYDGRGLALAGQITGAIGIALGVLIDVVYVAIIVFAFAGSSTPS